MKIRKLSTIFLVLLFLAGIVAGCATKSSNGVADDYFYSESAGSGIYDDTLSEVAGTSSEDAVLTERKLIKTVALETETENLDVLLAAITTRVSELGGYVESQQVYNGSAYATRYSRSASMTIRIPAEKLDGFIDHVADSTNIVSENAYIDDVTLTYVATESRVEALRTEEERLLELMSQAGNMADLLEVEARLTDVRYELESVTSQLNVLENQINYSTVNLSVEEVQRYTPVEEETFWQRVSGGFIDSLEGIGDGVVEIAVFVLANLPYLLLLTVTVAIVVLLVKRAVRKKKKARKTEENQE